MLVTFLIAKMKYLRKATYRVCFCSQLGGIVPHGEGGTMAECQTVGHIVCPGREQKRLLLIRHSRFSFYDIKDPRMEWGCLHSGQAFPAHLSPS